MSINVLIAGDNFPFVYGLEAITQMVLSYACNISLVNTPEDLVSKLKEKNYQLLLSDTKLKELDGLVILEKVKIIQPEIRSLFIGAISQPMIVTRYMNAGANGFISSNATEKELTKALLDVISGKNYISEQVRQQKQNTLPAASISPNPFDQLSKKEFVVLLLLLKGKGTKEISTILGLKLSTTSTFRNRILKKLKVSNLVELLNIARQYNLDDNENPETL